MATKIQIRMDESMHERWVRAAGEVPLGRWVKLRIEEIVGGEVAASKAPVVVEAREPVPPAVPERKPLARPAEKERLSEQLARQTAGRRPFTPYSKEDQTERRNG